MRLVVGLNGTENAVKPNFVALHPQKITQEECWVSLAISGWKICYRVSVAFEVSVFRFYSFNPTYDKIRSPMATNRAACSAVLAINRAASSTASSRDIGSWTMPNIASMPAS